MLLSIVVLSYNRPEQIERILEGFLGFESSNLSLIIKDDLSPRRDEIERVFKKYSSKLNFEVRLQYNRDNLGYDRNLIDALLMSKSEYVMLLSDDDYIVSRHINDIVNSLEDKRCDFYYTPYFENGVLKRNPDGFYKLDDFSDIIYNSILFSGLVFRVKAVKELELDLKFLSDCIYSQVYIASRLIYRGGGYGVLPAGALFLGGDGANFFGKNESAKNSALLSNREIITSDLTYQQFLIRVVEKLSEDTDARIWGIFEKEYVKRLFAYGLRARAKGVNVFFDFFKYFIKSNVRFYLAPFVFFIILFLVPSNISKKIYEVCIRTLRKSG